MNITIYTTGPDRTNISTEEFIRRSLWQYNVEHGLGLTKEQVDTEIIKRTQKGKPFFSSIPLEFSISHSGCFWVCAMGIGPVGIDVQQWRPAKTMELAKRFFTREEADYVLKNGEKGFFRLWVGKEAYVKYLGEGISYGFDKFSLVENGSMIWETENPVPCFLQEIQLAEAYECIVCTREKEEAWIRTL